MSRFSRILLTVSLVAVLSGCMTFKQTTVVHEDLTMTQTLYSALDTSEAGDPFPGAGGDASVGLDTPTRVEFEQRFGDRFTYSEATVGTELTATIVIERMSVEEANQTDLYGGDQPITYALSETGGLITLVATFPPQETTGMDPSMLAGAIDFEHSYEFPGRITDHNLGTIDPADDTRLTLTLQEFMSGQPVRITARASGGEDAWWSFANPVIDPVNEFVEDTVGWPIAGAVLGGLLLLIILLAALRKRGRRGSPPVATAGFTPTAGAPLPGSNYAAGTTFMPQTQAGSMGPARQAAPPQGQVSPQGQTPYQGQPPQ